MIVPIGAKAFRFQCASDGVGNGPRCGGTEVIAGRLGTKQNAPDSVGVTRRSVDQPSPVLLDHRIESSPLPVNGTEVPHDVTLRPYSDSLLRLNLYPLAAGHFRER